MLTPEKLMEVFQELQDQDVLSVYVDADEHDPAQRETWRLRLEGEVARRRKALEHEGSPDLSSFDTAWALVDDRLRSEGDPMTKRGWVAFATAERLWHAGGIPARMPHSVRWQRGIHAAPYLRALKQERPVTVVLVDGRQARIFEQVEGRITELAGILADTELGDLTDVGTRKGSARATGVRGETSTDQASRILEVAGRRMRKMVADVIEERTRPNGIVVIGGPSESVKKLLSVLPSGLDGRVAERPGLHLDMTAAEVREEIRAAAGDLSEQSQQALLSEVVDAARAGGRGTLGKDDTLQALDGMRVDTLLLSRTFIQEHPGVADLAVRLAFTQGSDAEEVSGEAGAFLDREGQGIASRLRYRVD